MGIWNRLLGSFRGRRLNEDLAEEQLFHLELAARELVDGGMDPQEARRQAALRFGSRNESTEETRRQGYAFNDQGVIEGMSAVGVPVLGADGTALAALSVAAVTARMQAERRREVVDLLVAEARRLAAAMAGAALVRGEELPADLVSRGLEAAKLAPNRPGISVAADH